MKYLYFLATIVFLLLVVFACKKVNVPTQAIMDITDTKCKLVSQDRGNYYVKYDPNGKISEMYYTVDDQLLYQYQYENGLLRRVVRGVVAPSPRNPNGSEAFTEYEYEYGPVGIVGVSFWDMSGKRLVSRYEFKYDDYAKPKSMVYYQIFPISTGDDLRMASSSTFKYDGNGNLVQEEIENWAAGAPGTAENSIRRYHYDNAPNSVKILHSTRFDYFSPPAVFSTNNVVSLEYVNNDGTSKTIDVTQFDSSHNATVHYGWVDVKWDCDK